MPFLPSILTKYIHIPPAAGTLALGGKKGEAEGVNTCTLHILRQELIFKARDVITYLVNPICMSHWVT